MQFHKAPKHVPHLHLQINNNEISRVDTFNFLGLQINPNTRQPGRAFQLPEHLDVYT